MSTNLVPLTSSIAMFLTEIFFCLNFISALYEKPFNVLAVFSVIVFARNHTSRLFSSVLRVNIRI